MNFRETITPSNEAIPFSELEAVGIEIIEEASSTEDVIRIQSILTGLQEKAAARLEEISQGVAVSHTDAHTGDTVAEARLNQGVAVAHTEDTVAEAPSDTGVDEKIELKKKFLTDVSGGSFMPIIGIRESASNDLNETIYSPADVFQDFNLARTEAKRSKRIKCKQYGCSEEELEAAIETGQAEAQNRILRTVKYNLNSHDVARAVTALFFYKPDLSDRVIDLFRYLKQRIRDDVTTSDTGYTLNSHDSLDLSAWEDLLPKSN